MQIFNVLSRKLTDIQLSLAQDHKLKEIMIKENKNKPMSVRRPNNAVKST